MVKFLGKSVTIKVVKDFRGLSTATIREIQEVGILIIASNVFASPRFWATLGEFSTVGDVPTGTDASRYFLDRFKDCREGAQKQMDLLTTKPEIGVASKNVRQVHQNIVDGIKQSEKARKEAAANRHSMVRIGEKKLSGAAYDAFYNQNEDIESDDEDDDKTAADKRKKRAARAKAIEKGTYKPPAAPKARTPIPFALDDARTDWRNMKCPPIYAFMFERLIVDEFTYVAGRARSAIKELRAHATWVLSGTPNIQDFNEINESVSDLVLDPDPLPCSIVLRALHLLIYSIADLLHVHLGVPADLTASKTATKDKTSAEMFHSYRETHTQAWRAHRDEVGQRFLDGFVRQNQAEIDEIPLEEHVVCVRLPAAEQALYLELEHHLNTLVDSKLVKFTTVKKSEAPSVQDRLLRLRQATDGSKDMRTCLIKRSCGFDPPAVAADVKAALMAADDDNDDPPSEIDSDDDSAAKRKSKKSKAKGKGKGKANSKAKSAAVVRPANQSKLTPTEVCDLIANDRRIQRDDCLDDFRLSLKNAIELCNIIPWSSAKEKKESKFASWIQHAYRSGEGDPDVLATVHEIFAEFGVGADGTVGKNIPFTDAEKARKAEENDKDDPAYGLRTVGKGKKISDKARGNATYGLSDQTALLRTLLAELRSRTRSARYFSAVRHAQRDGPDPAYVCSVCGGTDSAETLSTSCGHTACWSCLFRQARINESCPVFGCDQIMWTHHLYQVAHFDRDGESGEFGAKMMALIRIVKEVATPKNENVLVFAQFGVELAIQSALKHQGVNVVVVQGKAKEMSVSISNFQRKTRASPRSSSLTPQPHPQRAPTSRKPTIRSSFTRSTWGRSTFTSRRIRRRLGGRGGMGRGGRVMFGGWWRWRRWMGRSWRRGRGGRSRRGGRGGMRLGRILRRGRRGRQGRRRTWRWRAERWRLSLRWRLKRRSSGGVLVSLVCVSPSLYPCSYFGHHCVSIACIVLTLQTVSFSYLRRVASLLHGFLDRMHFFHIDATLKSRRKEMNQEKKSKIEGVDMRAIKG